MSVEPPAPGGQAPARAGAGPLDLLLGVQDLDLAIAQLEHRRATLAERREMEAAESRLGELGRQAAALGEQRQALVHRQEELEDQIAGVSARHRTIEERMYAARGTPARDLQAMDEEARHLVQRRSELEEAELEVMEEQEPVDGALSVLSDERAQLSEAYGLLRGALEAAEAVVDVELSTLRSARAAEAARLPGDLRDRYESLRSRLGGVGAARLVGSRCSGCHLELPSMEVERVRNLPPGTVAVCEQCGRILVPVQPAVGPDAGPRPPR